MHIYLITFAILILSPITASSETSLRTVNFISKSALIGFKLASSHNSNDTLPPKVNECVQKLDESSFDDVVSTLVSKNLDQSELLIAEEFLATPTGKKYEKYALMRIYNGTGDIFSEELPELTEKEQLDIVKFVRTSVGSKLHNNEVVDPPHTRSDTIRNRMIELYTSCGFYNE